MALVERPTTWFEDMTQELGKFEPVLLECVADELGGIAAGDSKKARLARVALEMAESFGRETCGGGNPDDEIVSAAQGGGTSVATVDSGLRKTLKALGIRVLTLSGGRVFVS